MTALWNIRQVQEYLGVSRATVYRKVEKGIIPGPVNKRGEWPRWDPEQVMESGRDQANGQENLNI